MKAKTLSQRCQDAAMSGLCWLLSRPLYCVIAIVVALVTLPIGYLVALATCVAGFLMSAIVGGETRLRVSTLARALTFGYRRIVIRHKWRRVMESAGLSSLRSQTAEKHDTLLVPKLKRKMTQTPVGVIVSMDGSDPRLSIGFDQTAPKVSVIRAGLKARDVVARPNWDKLHQVSLMVIYSDPFKRPISYAELPNPSAPGRLVTGIDQDGMPAEKSVYISELLGGCTGSGKSSEVWARLKALCELSIPFELYVYDNKGGQEFSNLKDKAYAYEAFDFQRLLQHCMDDLADTQDRMSAAGHRSAPLDDPDYPTGVLLIDETVTAVMAMGAGAKKTVRFRGENFKLADALVVYATQGRASNKMVLACAQVVNKDVLGTLRAVLPIKTMLWADDDDMVRMLGFDPKIHPAHMVPKTKKYAGIGWMMSEDHGVIKYRGAYLNDAERDDVAQQIGEMTEYLRLHRAERREPQNA